MVGARHALHFQDDSIWKGRWRANLWVVTHILLIACVEALGNSLTTLLLPWMGYPDGSRENLGEARALVAVPIALILIVLIVPLAVRSELLEEACHSSASFSACEEWGYPTGGMWNNDGDCCACQGTQRCEDGYQLAVGLTHGDCHEPAAETACQVQTTCCIPDEGDGGRQYYRSDSTVSSRHDAVMYCGGEDQLARIDSAAENARAQTACGSRMCWIGLRDSANIGKWSWPSSET